MIAAQWQIFTWFSTARFLAFVLVEVVHVLSDSRDYVVPFLLANDILLLTWDVVTSGVWFATVVWQMVVAFVATAWVSFRLFTDGNVLSRGSVPTGYYRGPWATVLLSLLYPLLVFINLYLLLLLGKRHKELLKGVKETESDVSAYSITTAVFGRRRRKSPVNWKSVYVDLFSVTKSYIVLVFTRKITDAQTLAQALARNIVAVLLVSALLGRSFVLISQLFTTGISTRSYPSEGVPPSIDLSQVSLVFLNSSVVASSYNVTVVYDQLAGGQCADLPLSCEDSVFYLISQTMCSPPTTTNSSCSEPPTSIQIEVPVNTSTAPSDLGRFWLIPSNQNQHQDIVLTLAAISGSQLLPGQNVQGSIGFSLRRILSLSIFELMGFSPGYSNYTQLPITWLPASGNSPNSTIASATLTLERLPFEDLIFQQQGNKLYPPLYRIVEDYRPQTLLSVLTTIGGLLAAIQGLHNLLFGTPLFWGFAGSKALNPFGLFGSSWSKEIKKRYGQIPPGPDSCRDAHRLALFLCDFLLNTGPLRPDEDEDKPIDDQHEDGPIDVEEGDAISLKLLDQTESSGLRDYKEVL